MLVISLISIVRCLVVLWNVFVMMMVVMIVVSVRLSVCGCVKLVELGCLMMIVV